MSDGKNITLSPQAFLDLASVEQHSAGTAPDKREQNRNRPAAGIGLTTLYRKLQETGLGD